MLSCLFIGKQKHQTPHDVLGAHHDDARSDGARHTASMVLTFAYVIMIMMAFGMSLLRSLARGEPFRFTFFR